MSEQGTPPNATNNGDARSGDNRNDNSRNPPAGDVIPPAPQAVVNPIKRQDKPRHSHRDGYDVAHIIILALTLIAACIAAVFAGLAWCEMQRTTHVFEDQLAEMKKVYDPIKQSGDAAKAALVAGQRAWIRIDGVNVAGGGLTISRDGIGGSIAVTFTNIGNSPAIKLSHHIKLIVLATGIVIPDEQARLCDDTKRDPWQTGFTLFPNDQFPRSHGFGGYGIGTSISKEDTERGLEASADKKHVSLMVVGCIDYTFGTDPDTHHQTPIVRTLDRLDWRLGGISIDDKLIPPNELVLREFGIGVGRPAD